MQYYATHTCESYKVAILLKSTAFINKQIHDHYIKSLFDRGLHYEDSIAIATLAGATAKAKVSVKDIKAHLDTLLPTLLDLSVEVLYVTDSSYFKALTGVTKTEPYYGYCMTAKLKGFEHLKVVLGVNYQAVVFNPESDNKLKLGLDTVAGYFNDTYRPPGDGIIHSAEYPTTIKEIKKSVERLHQYKELSCDIETFSLDFNKAGIGTIAFAWDEHNGIAFPCDYVDLENSDQIGACGVNYSCEHKRKIIKDFLTNYKGKLTFHGSTFDVKVLIYNLWMQHPLDTEGLLKGLKIMSGKMHDTRIIAYLATNSTADISLSLKALAHEFAGNWAKENINDITRIPLKELLRYNLVDALATNYVKNKYTPLMIQDNQQDLYESLMLPSLKLIIQLELTGMPMDTQVIRSVKAQLQDKRDGAFNFLANNPCIKALNLVLQNSAMEAANAKLKTKQHSIEKFKDIVFNPNSGVQLQRLLYEQMGFPVLDLTDTKQPATGSDTLEKLIHHTDVEAYKDIVRALISYNKVNKILSTFIPAFERGVKKADGALWLHGSFNLGGTVSGRLSSSDPNMQNIPAGSEYGDLIKSCFVAPQGWLLVGADFNSLEDYISALTTRDKNKLKVYIEGYDGHCLRAYSYFKDECVGIENTVKSINSIKKLYPELRQNSKGPTFLLTYGGTYRGMMKNLGWPEDKAKAIEKGYHELYAESDQYVADRLKQACKDGYVTVAFGLRVRTPLLKQVIWGSPRMPYEAAAEGRTAANALGQSYGLLNNRAAVAFMEKVHASPYALDIKPVALIHDAIYLVVRDNPDVVAWVNQELTSAMAWQDLPELQHDTVKLGAELDIFWPSWRESVTLPTQATKEEIIALCVAHKTGIKGKTK